MPIKVCRPRGLPVEKLAAAERRALEINPENVEVLAGPQKFDAQCRKKIKPKLGERLTALEALLKLFV
jgi:hypothetical protein